MKCPNPGCGRSGYRSYDGYCSVTCANAHRAPQKKREEENNADIDYWVRNASLSSDNIFDGGSFNSAPDNSDFSGGGGSFDGGGSSGTWD